MNPNLQDLAKQTGDPNMSTSGIYEARLEELSSQVAELIHQLEAITQDYNQLQAERDESLRKRNQTASEALEYEYKIADLHENANIFQERLADTRKERQMYLHECERLKQEADKK
jgi:outer membrane murein-binding lipoprotein Lpp